jgi:hypothetical protein
MIGGVALDGTLLGAAPSRPALTTTALALSDLGILPLSPMLVGQLGRTSNLELGGGAAMSDRASGMAVLGAPHFLNARAWVVSLWLGFLTTVPLLMLVLLLRGRVRPRGIGVDIDPGRG